ncbi:MAG: TPM domain-containing protein [Nanoarchaeota archaeon]
MRKIIIFVFLFFLPLVLAKPVLNDWVVDEAAVLSAATETTLRALFQEVEKNTTAQMAVVTVQNLEGEPIEEYALSLAHNRLGNREKDNGLLLIIALEEREYRIEVGYGLEGVLNDAKVGRIAREHLVPYLQTENYDEGVLKTSFVLADVILGQSDIAEQQDNKVIVLWIILIIFLVIIIVALLSAGRQQGRSGSGRRTGWIGGFGGLGGRSGGGGGFGGQGGFGGGGSQGRY